MFERTAIIGAGAVGASIASMMIEAGRPVALVADAERAARFARDGIRVNGRHLTPDVDPDSRSGSPYDLVIVATKSRQLAGALPLVARAAGRDGIVVSLLNGISSEGVLRSALAEIGPGAAERVVPAMILGIDAVRASDGSVTYLNRGTIHYGADAAQAPVPVSTLDALAETFAASGIPAARSEDIVRTLWWKFMINVGINQASAVLRAPYGVFQASAPARELMGAAMAEVIQLSQAVGSGLTDDDLDAWFRTLATLDAAGKTSMLQDVEAGRPTEVDLFADTVVRLAGEHGVEAPVNRTLGLVIRAIDERAGGSSRPDRSAMYKLVCFVPPAHSDAVKAALFAAGAGRYERYDSCAYETRGAGQFRPLAGSDPYVGSTGVVERVEEVRIEMVCADAVVRRAIAALIEAHPYEEPAYELYRIWTADDLPPDLP